MIPRAGEVLSLPISARHHETADAVTLTFDDPEGTVGGEAGQYVIVRVTVDGEEHLRVFSLSSTPELGQPPSITVKRLPGGVVSTYLLERARVGDVIGVEPAAGTFGVGIDPANRRTYYALAAGSGIVPIMSILRGAVTLECRSTVHLAYGNRRPQDVIFHDALERLERRFPDRLGVSHVMSGMGQRIDYRYLDAFLISHPPRTADVWYLLCGPPGMNWDLSARLRTLGVPEDRLRVEHYLPPQQENAPVPYDPARILLEGHHRSAELRAGEVLLAAMDRIGAPVPYACRSGVCGTCRVELVEGQVDPGIPFALTAADRQAGAILTCVARPTSPEVILRYPS